MTTVTDIKDADGFKFGFEALWQDNRQECGGAGALAILFWSSARTLISDVINQGALHYPTRNLPRLHSLVQARWIRRRTASRRTVIRGRGFDQPSRSKDHKQLIHNCDSCRYSRIA